MQPIVIYPERQPMEISSYAKSARMLVRMTEPDQGYSQGTLGGLPLGDFSSILGGAQGEPKDPGFAGEQTVESRSATGYRCRGCPPKRMTMVDAVPLS